MNALDAAADLTLSTYGPQPDAEIPEVTYGGKPIPDRDAWILNVAALAEASGELDDVEDGDVNGIIQAADTGIRLVSCGVVEEGAVWQRIKELLAEVLSLPLVPPPGPEQPEQPPAYYSCVPQPSEN